LAALAGGAGAAGRRHGGVSSLVVRPRRPALVRRRRRARAAPRREVAATIARGVSTADFTNDSPLFKHEWQFGTYQMGALGLLQVCREHPELRAEFLPAAEQAIDNMLSDAVRAFDAAAWHEDALATLDGNRGHAAYLGYLNAVLGVHRALVPESRFTALNDRISAALARRFAASPTGIIETYPGEAYPVDNAPGLASLLLHQRAGGGDHADVIRATLERYRAGWRDPRSGLLWQALDDRTGRPVDNARASGTALAAYFLSLAEGEASGALYSSLREHCAGSRLGFGYMLEFPRGTPAGRGDVDSGPVLLGTSISGTGFALANARAAGDRAEFVALYRLAHLVGSPQPGGGFVCGGPLGNAIMLAMLTAQPPPPPK
jgi:hypothetical protein